MRVSLISTCDPLATPLPVTATPFLIGRAEECHLRLNNALVSRHHAELRSAKGRVRAYDCGSLNGTTVNGRPAGRDGVALRDGDLLGVSTFQFLVRVARSSDELSRMGEDTRPQSDAEAITRVPETSRAPT